MDAQDVQGRTFGCEEGVCVRRPEGGVPGGALAEEEGQQGADSASELGRFPPQHLPPMTSWVKSNDSYFVCLFKPTTVHTSSNKVTPTLTRPHFPIVPALWANHSSS